MTTKQIASNFSNSNVDTIEDIFTASTSNNVVIESFTAANNSGVNASYKAYIVSPSGIEQPQRPFKIVVWGEVDLGIGIINQVIPAGGALRVESSALNSIYFTITGREVSA
jgi:hypothetical protein